MTAPDVTPIRETAEKLVANVSTVIVGKEAVIELCLVALLCEGHILFEDVPGIGKTTLAKAIARSVTSGPPDGTRSAATAGASMPLGRSRSALATPLASSSRNRWWTRHRNG